MFHIQISGVSVFDSIRKPMLLTMLGSDGRKYPFIAKAGEDIRQGLSI